MAVKDLNIHNEFDMSYIDTGAVQPGKELVLIHGWCSNKFHWNPQIDFFKNSFRVIAMDLRGHGASFAPDDGYSFRNFASDINYLLDDLGVKHPIIFGHSMGGAIAIHLAAAFGSNARGLVMVDGSLNIAEQESNLESNERIRSFKQNDSSSEIADRYESFFSHMNDASLGKMIIKDAIKTVNQNRNINLSKTIENIEYLKKDENIKTQLKTGNTIGCFYIESPGMRMLLKKQLVNMEKEDIKESFQFQISLNLQHL